MTVRIAHLSDTHLGYSDLERVNAEGINCREADMYRAFSAAVDDILLLKPDAVVHTGDFFHRPSPPNRPMTEGLTQLKRLSDAKIPFVVIAGNHSTPRTIFTSPILKAFRSIDLVYPVFEQKRELIEIGGIAFNCVPHVNDEILFSEELKMAEPVSGKVNLMLLHTSVGKNFMMDEYGERVLSDADMKMLDNYHYTAIGHWHNFQQVTKLKSAWYSGSTERLSEKEAGRDKGFVIVEISDTETKVEFRPLPVRPWLRFEITDCSGRLVEDIKNEITKAAEENDTSEAIVSVILNDIKSEQAVELSNQWLGNQFPISLAVLPRRNYKLQTNRLSDTSGPGETLDDIFSGFLAREIPDEKERSAMEVLAKKYFQRHEMGE
jgi:DNA repair exonuclease SbcCD nuclease subunit